MKKILFLLAFATFLMAGCNNNEVIEKLPSSLVLDKSIIDAPVNGGTLSVNYSIANPVDETTLPTVTPGEGDWISNFAVNATVITFDVESAEELPEDSIRTMKVEVMYPELEVPVSFTINQKGGLPAGPENISFAIETNVNGKLVEVKVTPEDYDDYYHFIIWETATVGNYLIQGYDLFGLCSEVWNSSMELYLENGMTAQDVLDNVCSKGQDSYVFEQLQFDTEYTVLVYAIDEETMTICSEPVTSNVITDVFVPSEIEFDIDVTDITWDSFKVKVTPTTDDTYTFFIFEDNTEEEIREVLDLWIQSGNIGETLTGTYEREYIKEAKPETNYTITVFGYKDAAVTTELTMYTFRTLKTPETDVTCQVEVGDYYDFLEIEEINPEGAWDVWSNMGYNVIIPVKAVVSEGVEEYYFNLCPISWLEDFPDEADFKREITYKGMRAPYIQYEHKLKYGEEVIPCGFAVDADGNYGELWKGEPFTVTEEGVSDPQDFMDYWNALYGTATQSSVSENKPLRDARIITRHSLSMNK